MLINIPPRESCIEIKGIAKPKAIITIKILKMSLLKYVDIISEGVTKPNLFENIHCLLEKITPIKGIPITHKEVRAKGNPFIKIKLGCTKNIQPEKMAPVKMAK
tara:strand:+ start:226 stop:537 length:312 start_codon:yes stop_codon:yes gene_type:complete